MVRRQTRLPAVLALLPVLATACGGSRPGGGVMHAPAPAPPGSVRPLVVETPQQVVPVPDPHRTLAGRLPLRSPPHEEGADRVAQMLVERTAGMPGAGPVALEEPGPGVLLHWYGDPPSDVLAEAAAQHPDVSVEVVPMARSTEDVTVVQHRVLEDFASRGVGCASAAPDASALDVCVDHELDDDQRRALVADVEDAAGMPVTIAPGGNPVAAPARP